MTAPVRIVRTTFTYTLGSGRSRKRRTDPVPAKDYHVGDAVQFAGEWYRIVRADEPDQVWAVPMEGERQ